MSDVESRSPPLANLVRAGYQPQAFIERSPRLAEALSLIESGFFSFGEGCDELSNDMLVFFNNH